MSKPTKQYLKWLEDNWQGLLKQYQRLNKIRGLLKEIARELDMAEFRDNQLSVYFEEKLKLEEKQ